MGGYGRHRRQWVKGIQMQVERITVTVVEHSFDPLVIAFDKGERLHSAVTFENFGPFIDTDLAPPKNSSGAKLFRENDVIFIGHVLNFVLRLSLLCLLNEVAMCFVSTSFNLPRVLLCFLVQFDLLFAFGVLPCRILDSASLFILFFPCSRSQSPRLRDVNLGNSRICIC